MNGSGVSSISPVLRKTNVTVMSNEQCATYYNIIYPGLICIDTRDGHGSCNVRHLLHLICFQSVDAQMSLQGDSGGPLSVVGSDDLFTEVGIVSFGSSAGCEAGYPAGVTRVTSFLAWISAITGIAV